jgi:hypothetical protein
MTSARRDRVSLAKQAGAVLITIAVIMAAGCSAPGRLRLLAAGPRGYWNRDRLLGARPFLLHGRLVRRPGQSANSHPAGLALRVGALFVREGSSDHFCTASVVDSPGRDLLITAAHCLNGGQGGGGYRQDIVFIPDYRDGEAPFGIWTPKRLLVAPQWIGSSDPALDVGFVVLEPNDGRNIEDVLGHPFRRAHPDRHDRRCDRRLPARRGHRVRVVQRLPEPGRAAPLPPGRRRHPLTFCLVSPGRAPG